MRITRGLGWRKAVVVGLLLLAGLLQACTSNDSTKGPTFPSTIAGGTATAIVLTSSSGNVSCGSTITITAIVLSSTGQPIAGVTVIFDTTVGSVSPTTAVTNAGEAKTTFDPASTATCLTGASGATGSATITGSVRTITSAGVTATSSDALAIAIVKL